MRCLKRAVLSLKYRYKAYLVLFLGFFILTFILAVSLGMEEDAGRIVKNLRVQYGGTIDVFSLSGTAFKTVEESSWLPEEDVEKIKALPETERLYCQKDALARAIDFHACGIAEKEKADEADIILYGMDSPEKNALFTTGGYQILEGDLTVEGNHALVPKLLADENGWTMGSSIKAGAMDSEKEAVFEVSGIFSCENNYVSPNYANPINGIIVSAENVLGFSRNFAYKACSIQIRDPYMVPEVIKKIESLDLTAKEKIGLGNASIDYLTTEQPLKSIQALLKVISVGVVVLGVIVLLIYVYNILAERTLEIGILFAMGEKKRYILGQIALEIFVVLLAGYLIGIVAVMGALPIFGKVFLPLVSQQMEGVLLLSMRVKGIILTLLFFMELVLMLVPFYLMAREKPREILTGNES